MVSSRMNKKNIINMVESANDSAYKKDDRIQANKNNPAVAFQEEAERSVGASIGDQADDSDNAQLEGEVDQIFNCQQRIDDRPTIQKQHKTNASMTKIDIVKQEKKLIKVKSRNSEIPKKLSSASILN